MNPTVQTILGVIGLAVVGFGIWWMLAEDSEPVSQPFNEEGVVVRNNPGLTPNVWHLVYEQAGNPALSVALDLSNVEEPTLAQGMRVRVEGTLLDATVQVTSISLVEDPAETGTRVLLYYYDPARDQGEGGVQCSREGLVAVERTIPETTTPLRDSVALLLRGDIAAEEAAEGIETEFPLPGLTLENATIEDGEAVLTFSDPQNQTTGGACRAGILWFQIEATALQFPTVKSVRFEPEELFQP